MKQLLVPNSPWNNKLLLLDHQVTPRFNENEESFIIPMLKFPPVYMILCKEMTALRATAFKINQLKWNGNFHFIMNKLIHNWMPFAQPLVCRVLYDLQLRHFWATKWNLTWQVFPQSLHRIQTCMLRVMRLVLAN